MTHERHPLMLDPVHQERAKKVKRDCCVVHVEDLEELRNTTPRAVTNGNTRKENHSVVVDEVLDRPLVERKAHVEKPHKDVHDEVFQYSYKLWNVFHSNFIKKRKTAKVSVLDFPQFVFQKLAERVDVFPQILEKTVSCLENRVGLPKNFKDEHRKAEMLVDEGIFERERDVFDGAKGAFWVCNMLSPLITVSRDGHERVDRFRLVEHSPQRVPVVEPPCLGGWWDLFLFGFRGFDFTNAE